MFKVYKLVMLIFTFVIYFAILKPVDGANLTWYVATEHPAVTGINPHYVKYANLTAQRYSRWDPYYYLGMHSEIIWPVHNNVNVHFVFYELLSNRYRPSFVDLRFAGCDLVEKDLFFGVSFSKAFTHPCPIEPGVYHFENMTVPLKSLPYNFPFTKGRVEANFTSLNNELLLGLRVDMEIKVLRTRKMKNQK